MNITKCMRFVALTQGKLEKTIKNGNKNKKEKEETFLEKSTLQARKAHTKHAAKNQNIQQKIKILNSYANIRCSNKLCCF